MKESLFNLHKTIYFTLGRLYNKGARFDTIIGNRM